MLLEVFLEIFLEGFLEVFLEAAPGMPGSAVLYSHERGGLVSRTEKF